MSDSDMLLIGCISRLAGFGNCQLVDTARSLSYLIFKNPYKYEQIG